MKKFLFATTILLGTTLAVSAQAKVAKPVTKMEKVKITDADADHQAAVERAKKEKIKRAQKISTTSPMTSTNQEGNKDSKTTTTVVKSKTEVKAKAIKTKKAE